MRVIDILWKEHILFEDFETGKMETAKKIQNEISLPAQGRLGIIVLYVDQHFHEDIKAKTISQEFGVSASSLEHLFLKHYQCSFRLYVEKLRMQLAYDLIVSRGMMIKEAMYMSGYKNRSTFRRAFIRHFKITPSDLIR